MSNATVQTTAQKGMSSTEEGHASAPPATNGSFQLFDALKVIEVDTFKGSFIVEPLEKGYGRTLGNALRRVLLASLEGYAITCIRIPGVAHEFTTIKGVVEDVVQLVLNFKQVIFKKVSAVEEEKLLVKVADQTALKAGDLAKFTSSFEILNPDFVLCHLDKGAHFEFELTLGKGRGYSPAEEYKSEEQVIGAIPIDAIFTPIKNVAYRVENTRVGDQTDYDKLVLDIETDGSIHPKEALHTAADILIKHLLRLGHADVAVPAASEQPATAETAEDDEELVRMRRTLETPIADLDLSVRARNCLKTSDIETLGDLVALEEAVLIKLRNLGKKSLEELRNVAKERNLTFNTDLSAYGIRRNKQNKQTN